MSNGKPGESPAKPTPLMSRATPGPWYAVQRQYGYPEYAGGPEVRLWDVHTASGTPVAIGTIYGDSKANACLQAAAPDLLAACREALNWPDEDEYGNAMEEQYATPAYRAYRQRLRDAISKAESDR